MFPNHAHWPFPSLDKTFSLVLGQERQLNLPQIMENSNEKQSLTLQVSNNGYGRGQLFSNRGRERARSGGGRINNRFCTHCQCTNHTIDTCDLKHGFSPDFQSKNSKPLLHPMIMLILLMNKIILLLFFMIFTIKFRSYFNCYNQLNLRLQILLQQMVLLIMFFQTALHSILQILQR